MQKKLIIYIISLTKVFPAGIFFMVFSGIFWAVEVCIGPFFLKNIIDTVINWQGQDSIWQPILPQIIFFASYFFIISTAYRLHGYFVWYKTFPKMRALIAKQAVDILLKKDHEFFLEQSSGDLGSKVKDLTLNVPELFISIFDKFFTQILGLVFAIIMLLYTGPIFGLALFLWSSVFLILCLFYVGNSVHTNQDYADSHSKAIGYLVDVFANVLQVKLFSSPKKEIAHFTNKYKEVEDKERKMEWLQFLIWSFYGYSYAIFHFFNVIFLFNELDKGNISIGDFCLVLSLNFQVVSFVWQIANEFPNFSRLLGKINQALEVIEKSSIPENNLNIRENFKITKGKIEFKKVCFAYNKNVPIFENQNLLIEAGSKLGLVGFSGGGKTTLINLILKLHKVNKGQILIDNMDINFIDDDDLRAQIATIPQDTSLFHRSIFENIHYANLKATKEEVYDAAKKSLAHDFIMKLPEQYNTIVGEKGMKLSGGQKQRIAIARAILKNSPILLIDEATSQLDSITERNIQESLIDFFDEYEKQKNTRKTIVVIAHRLSTLLKMDRILVFEKGDIVQDGPHRTLIKQEGLYRELWENQNEGSLVF